MTDKTNIQEYVGFRDIIKATIDKCEIINKRGYPLLPRVDIESKRYKLFMYFMELGNEKMKTLRINELQKSFPEESINTLNCYISEYRKKEGLPRLKGRLTSHTTQRQIIFKYLNENEDARDIVILLKNFPEYSQKALSFLLYDWAKMNNITLPKGVMSASKTRMGTWTDEELDDLRIRAYRAYINVMHKMGRDPLPPKDTTTTKIVRALSDETKKSMTNVEACKLISCDPSIMKLAKIADDHSEVNYEETVKVIREINKRLYKINKFRAPSVIVGAAIYLANKNLSQAMAADLANITEVSMRTTMRITRLDRKGGTKHSHKLYMDQYEKALTKRQERIIQEEVSLRDKIADDIKWGIIPYGSEMSKEEKVERYKQLYTRDNPKKI